MDVLADPEVVGPTSVAIYVLLQATHNHQMRSRDASKSVLEPVEQKIDALVTLQVADVHGDQTLWFDAKGEPAGPLVDRCLNEFRRVAAA